MLFSKLVDYLARLEETSKRLEMTAILADLFKKADEEDIAPIIYLTQERLGPAYEPTEFGIGEALASDALAEATGKDRAQIRKQYKQKGDYGTIAEELLPDKSKRLTITEVYDR